MLSTPTPTRAEQTVTRTRTHWYAAFGLLIRSDIPFPVPALADHDGLTPDVVFHRIPAGQAAPDPDGPLAGSVPCPVHGVDLTVHRGPRGAVIRSHLGGTYHVSPSARHVDVYANPGCRDEELALVIAGQVAIFVLHQLGYPSLHASAVAMPHGAVAFLGSKGQGKSTAVAGLLRQGATLLTDDVLALQARRDGIYAAPGLPLMKVWQQTAEHALSLDASALPNLIPDLDKKLFTLDGRYAFAANPARVRALYVLDRYDPVARGRSTVSTRQLAGRDALTRLLGGMHQAAFLRPDETARFLGLYARLLRQAPLRVLSYPNGFEFQDQVIAVLAADLIADEACR